MQKSTFGFKPKKTTKPVIEQREEIGAIWEHISKNNNKYMNIRFNVDKKKLVSLIESATEDGIVKLDLLAFPNKHNEGNSKRPVFRIFERKDSK